MSESDTYEAQKKRFEELRERAERIGRFVYTDFHSPHGTAVACSLAGSFSAPELMESGYYRVSRDISIFGGYEDADRQMIRFGDQEVIGYDGGFPISLVLIAPKQQRFAEELSHRDFLGALMNLGIERDVLGDIIVHKNSGYVFATEKIADYIVESLDRVRHTPVISSVIDALPEDAKPRLKEMDINISSLRLDAIVSHVFHLSRSEVKGLFSSEKVSVGGLVQKSASKEPKEGDTISVRGHGKLKFVGVSHETKKGHLVVKIEKFV